jgi:hypothetical protein
MVSMNSSFRMEIHDDLSFFLQNLRNCCPHRCLIWTILVMNWTSQTFISALKNSGDTVAVFETKRSGKQVSGARGVASCEEEAMKTRSSHLARGRRPPELVPSFIDCNLLFGFAQPRRISARFSCNNFAHTRDWRLPAAPLAIPRGCPSCVRWGY